MQSHLYSQADKELSIEEEVFIKVLKVTCFFVTLSNVDLEGNTITKQIVKIEQFMAQSNRFLGVCYSYYKKSYILYYNMEYDLCKTMDQLKSQFSQATIIIGNSKFDR